MIMVGIFVKKEKKKKQHPKNNSNIVYEYFGEDSILYYTW